MLRTFLLTAFAFMFMGLAASAQTSSLDSLLSFYPYQVGNVWTYTYTTIPDRSGTFDFTDEVIGDTVTPRGKRFMKIRRTWPYGTLVGFVRIDTISGSVYSPGPDSLETEYMNDSLGCSITEPCACGRYEQGELFGEPVLKRKLTCQLSVRIDVELAQGVGMVRQVNTGQKGKEILVLRHARINGREYGSLQSVDGAGSINTGFRLAQNSPNPFTTATTINYSIPVPAHVNISVTTLPGEPVATLVDEKRPAGEGTALFDASSLPSGTYLCTLRSGGHMITRRMVVAR